MSDIAMKDTDEATRLAWADRMEGRRDGYQAAVEALKNDGMLASDYTVKEATNTLWSQRHFVETTKELAKKMFVA